MDIIEATLRARGEVTFTSREVGRLAETDSHILNTALYYALGLARGQYVDTSHEPTYLDDTAEIRESVYVTPAAPIPGTTPQYVTTTYNTSRDEYVEVNYSAQDDPYEKQNLPRFGRRRPLRPVGRGTCGSTPDVHPARKETRKSPCRHGRAICPPPVRFVPAQSPDRGVRPRRRAARERRHEVVDADAARRSR